MIEFSYSSLCAASDTKWPYWIWFNNWTLLRFGCVFRVLLCVDFSFTLKFALSMDDKMCVVCMCLRAYFAVYEWVCIGCTQQLCVRVSVCVCVTKQLPYHCFAFASWLYAVYVFVYMCASFTSMVRRIHAQPQNGWITYNGIERRHTVYSCVMRFSL